MKDIETNEINVEEKNEKNANNKKRKANEMTLREIVRESMKKRKLKEDLLTITDQLNNFSFSDNCKQL